MDVLTDIVATLELQASLYFRAELSAPWAIAVPADRHVIRFHVAGYGQSWIGLPSGESLTYAEGDLVLVPHGSAHVLADSPQTTPVPLPGVLEDTAFDGVGPLRYGGGGVKTVIVCGYFGFNENIVHPIIDTLPPIIHIRGRHDRNYVWLEQLLSFLEQEFRSELPGAMEVVRRISEILFIQVLRSYIQSPPKSPMALGGLADPYISLALNAIHEAPATEWSLDRLADIANLSRSAFAERFRVVMSMPPMRYVTQWRVHRARSLLARGDLSISQIARAVGYASDAAFSRVFREYVGTSPSIFRRSWRQP